MDNLSTYIKGEMRRYERKPYGKSIEYSVDVLDRNEQKKLNLRGDGIDISDVGIGIQTDYPLAPGHTLWFENEIEKAGIVRWCVRLDNTYRAGIWLDTKVRYSRSLSKVIKEEVSFTVEKKEEYTKLLNGSIEKFNNQLEDIEKRCNGMEKHEEIMKEITRSMNDMVSVCEKYEQGVNYDRAMIKNAQIKFREKTNYIFSKSYFFNRARTWPHGYQGDYKTLEGIYRNIPLSGGIGYYMDRSFLDAPLAKGVRNRIKRIEELLRDEIMKREEQSVLNIACGSCRELMGSTTEIGESKAKIICVDNDNDAIAFAQNRLSYTDILPHIELYKYNALRMFDYELNKMEFGMQDIIYSVGYFDYLPNDFLTKMLNALYALLNPGGRLIGAFKDSGHYRAQEYHWLVDWDGFLQRTKDDFDKLFYHAGIPDNKLSISREETGVIIFYVATK
jgi:SAM-dependent methyltransferase